MSLIYNIDTYSADYDDEYICYRGSDVCIYRKWDREKRRKERGNYEYEQMLKRYDIECGDCIIINPK